MRQQTFKIAMKEGNTFREVKGNVAFRLFGFKWMIHKRPDHEHLFDVSELSTGAGLPLGQIFDRQEAIKAAHELLIKHGEKNTIKCVNEAKEIVNNYTL